MGSERAGRALTIARTIALVAVRIVWVSTMVVTPLFGFWLASSLAAYHNASQWLALLGGLVVFPLLPVGWEALSAWRRSRREVPGKQILTRLDRLVLRTLATSGVFLAIVLWLAHATAFRALAVRGDWMLDGHDGPIATELRGVLLGIADRFDRRHDREIERYGTSDDAPERIEPGRIQPRRTDAIAGEPADPGAWPLPDDPDPRIADMPEAAQASIESVGAYIAEHFPDRKQRVKAIHDFIALRLDYDEAGLAAYQSGAPRPPQDAVSVFASRKAVCEGYARLMVAIGKAASVEVKYVTGWIRDAQRRLAASDDTAREALHGYLHAWNAVLIDDEWFLVDVTWDDPIGASAVRSTYLFTPPELFALDHLPEDPAWQLVMSPMSLGDFARQPFLSPDIGRLGLTLESPRRSQVSVRGEVTIELANPRELAISAYSRLDDGSRREGPRCDVTTAARRTRIRCALDHGEHEVVMFGAPPGSRTLGHFGSILVNSR
jgi:hypothetical protein